MPELPEVETSRRGIAPWLVEQQVRRITIRERRLRWPVPRVIDRKLPGSFIRALSRRAKYLLFETEGGTLILHLGMSGSLRIIDPREPPGKHDHVDIELTNGKALRFRDPRRFGSLLWTNDPQRHPLLAGLGPEPLSAGFDGAYLWKKARGRRIAVKSFIMNAAVVVGVGNIYARESLFRARIHPTRRADRISAARMAVLAAAIKAVLQRAIAAGGTTFSDFQNARGDVGNYQKNLQVYDHEGDPCPNCGKELLRLVQQQRSTFYARAPAARR
jgi:formamidopyrimidine-DNA glycosylase